MISAALQSKRMAQFEKLKSVTLTSRVDSRRDEGFPHELCRRSWRHSTAWVSGAIQMHDKEMGCKSKVEIAEVTVGSNDSSHNIPLSDVKDAEQLESLATLTSSKV